jgi:C_GCAxxG_C_C family probable redox protein
MPNQESSTLGDRAQELLAVSGNCAQSSFAVLAEHLGIDAAGTLKALTPFPGIALRGETCGAVVGSVMAIGMVLGRDRLDDYPGMRPSLAVARRFCRSFENQFGGTACQEVLQQGLGDTFDLASTEGVAAYLGAGGHEHCSIVVAHSVQTAADMLAEPAGF